jgi:hypothetical protein
VPPRLYLGIGLARHQTVQARLAQVNYESYDKVAYVELDFIPEHMFRQPSLRRELWGGFGLVLGKRGSLVRSSDPPGSLLRAA